MILDIHLHFAMIQFIYMSCPCLIKVPFESNARILTYQKVHIVCFFTLGNYAPNLDNLMCFFTLGYCASNFDRTSIETEATEEKFGSNISHLSHYSEISEKSMEKFVSVITSFRCSSSGSRASGLRAPLKDVQNSCTTR